MTLTKKINLDFSVPIAPEIMRIRCGDTAREIEFHLYDGGAEVRIPSGATAVLAVTKPSGIKKKTEVIQSAESNVVTVILTQSMVNEVGRCIASLSIEDGSTAISNTFYIAVEDSPAFGALDTIDVETCVVEFDGSQNDYVGQMYYTAVENGAVTAKFELDFSTPAKFTVVKNSYLYLSGGVPAHSGNVEDVDGHDGSAEAGHCKITGNVVLYC